MNTSLRIGLLNLQCKTPPGFVVSKRRRASGFSLVELSIVLLIVGILASASVAPLSNTIRQARYQQTRAHLQTIREALHGYAISAGHLPCPIAEGASDVGQALQDQPCISAQGGLPAVSLGVMGARSASGALLDAWGREYTYAVSLSDHASVGTLKAPDWLTSGEPAAVGAGKLAADLQLCRTAAKTRCPSRDLIANQIVWVVISHGETDARKGLESENRDGNSIFGLNAFSSNPEQPFDDQLAWASRSEMVYWLLKANWLP